MITKVKEEEKNLNFSLPSHISEEVNNKGFYLYEWISPKDVKLSIERDFLKLLNVIWIPLAIVAIVLWIMFYGDIILMIGLFLLIVWSFIGVLFLYLLFSSIRKSILLSKSAFVVLTDSYVLIAWKIVKIDEVWKLYSPQIQKIASVFEEELFSESQIDKTKSKLVKNVMSKFLSWYERITKIMLKWWNNKMVWFGLLVMIFYTIYGIIMAGVYFLWISVVWIFGIFLVWVNEFILYKLGHEFTVLNSLFIQIWASSDIINHEKNSLLVNLEKAKNNEWKDALLTNINDWISRISNSANNAINDSVELKIMLEKSKYKEMFNFWIYNNWIKKQILEPLNEIYILLKTNFDILKQTKTSIEKQIIETKEDAYKWVLTAQKSRLEMRIDELSKYMEMIQVYITKIS